MDIRFQSVSIAKRREYKLRFKITLNCQITWGILEKAARHCQLIDPATSCAGNLEAR